MYEGQTVSVVMPAFNEEAGVEATVRGFVSHPYVDEVIVVDNNSTDRTAELAAAAGATVISEPRQGLGYACLTGLRSATGDLVVLTESDDSFYPDDLRLLFAYIPHFDMVKGARSNCHLVAPEADWTFFLKFGNWFVAKFMQLLYFGTSVFENISMREMGGTFRVIRKSALEAVLPHLAEGRSAFLADLTSVAIRKGFRILEIPLRYRKRVGASKITGDRWNAMKLGVRMLWVITKNRFKSFR